MTEVVAKGGGRDERDLFTDFHPLTLWSMRPYWAAQAIQKLVG